MDRLIVGISLNLTKCYISSLKIKKYSSYIEIDDEVAISGYPTIED
jgi:hypothetical protein